MGDTQAFGELAGNYHEFRPDYPAPVLARLAEYVRSGAQPAWPQRWLLADIGSGTGISTRALHELFGDQHDLLGVEPGHAMLDTARAAEPAGSVVRYVEGGAESLPLSDGTAMLVLAAQALQWFDRPAYYREAVRVLRPGGTLAVLQNDRDFTASALLDGYESLMEKYGDNYSRHYRSFDIAGELDAVAGLGDAVEAQAAWVRVLDRKGFAGMASSSTKMHAVVRRLGRQRATAELDALLDQHCTGDRVEVPYLTRLFLRRREV